MSVVMKSERSREWEIYYYLVLVVVSSLNHIIIR